MSEQPILKNDTVVVNNRRARKAPLGFKTTIILLSLFFILLISFSCLLPVCRKRKIFAAQWGWYDSQIRVNNSQKLLAAGKNLGQTDPDLINELQNLLIQPASCAAMYNLMNPNIIDPSIGAARIARILTNYKVGGFFVEYRAGGGERMSDTLFMERFLGWTGLLIEIDPVNIDSLQKIGRKSWIAPTCLSVNTSAYLTRYYPHGAVLDRIIGMTFGQGYKDNGATQSACYPFYSHIIAMNRTQVDFLSLDAEGDELQILQSIPFEILDISVVSVKYSRTIGGPLGIKNLLEGKQYRIISEIAPDYLILAKRDLHLHIME